MIVRNRPSPHHLAATGGDARARRGVVRVGAPANDNRAAAGRAGRWALWLLCAAVLAAAAAAVLL
jgi:hypothetical protein